MSTLELRYLNHRLGLLGAKLFGAVEWKGESLSRDIAPDNTFAGRKLAVDYAIASTVMMMFTSFSTTTMITSR